MTPATTTFSPAALHARCGRAPSRAGFTLIEAMVAVGAMALVTVGIAAIFSSVGKTVAAGRRVSVLNAQAAMIEQQMRHDFANMTREGFLMIRHSWADPNFNGMLENAVGADWVGLSAQDARPRHRRIDEIMFFANGDFASVREPLHPAYSATSKNARIYYGHGTRLPTNAIFPGNRNPYSQPEIDDPNNAAITGRLGEPNKPNQFAASWTLLRHVTLLVRPESTTPALPPDMVFTWNPQPTNGPGARLLYDKDGQISLQPAATSIFRSLANVLPDRGTGALSRGVYIRQVQSANRHPRFASGIVDIANNDLTDIRSVVLGMPLPAYGAGNFNNANQYPPNTPGFGVPPNPGWNFTPGAAALTNSRTWMENAWPTSSEPVVTQAYPPNSDTGTRIRYEPGPPELIDAISGVYRGGRAEQAYRRADQLALTASNFVAGCTEFVVEWSFGNSDPVTGELVWHGLQRRADVDGNGTVDRTVARPYPRDASDQPAGGKDSFAYFSYTDLDGKFQKGGPGNTKTLVNAALVYTNPTPPADAVSQTAYFGYIDPTSTTNGTDGDGRPWPWPTLVRVTMSLTDPKNPGTEETFQFVFPTPGNPK